VKSDTAWLNAKNVPSGCECLLAVYKNARQVSTYFLQVIGLERKASLYSHHSTASACVGFCTDSKFCAAKARHNGRGSVNESDSVKLQWSRGLCGELADVVVAYNLNLHTARARTYCILLRLGIYSSGICPHLPVNLVPDLEERLQ